MENPLDEKRVKKSFLILACTALPVWLVNLAFADWAAQLALISFLVVLFFLCKTALHSKNARFKFFTFGALLGQGLIPLVVLAFIGYALTLVFGDTFFFIRAAEVLITPGYEFFLQLEERLSLDAVTYTTWYVMVRVLAMRIIDCLVHGTLAVLIYETVKRARTSTHEQPSISTN